MEKKIFGSICLVLGIAIIVSTGASFAYFSASASSEGNISGTTVNFGINLNLTTIHQSINMKMLKRHLKLMLLQRIRKAQCMMIDSMFS